MRIFQCTKITEKKHVLKAIGNFGSHLKISGFDSMNFRGSKLLRICAGGAYQGNCFVLVEAALSIPHHHTLSGLGNDFQFFFC